jgi:hypothetical protein
VLKYSPEYQLVFSLLVGNPNDAIVNWEIKDTLQKYMSPLLRQVSNITSFAVTSQIQNYAFLSHNPPSVTKNGNTFYEMYPKVLSHYFNSAEWNLGIVDLISLGCFFLPPCSFCFIRPSKSQHTFGHSTHKRNCFKN